MAQNSAGIKLYYVSGTSSNTDTWTQVPGITTVPDIGGEPEMLDSTTLDAEKYKTYIAGLQDMGGALAFEAYLTSEFYDAIMKENTGAVAKGKTKWRIVVPTPFDKDFVWMGTAQPLGMRGVGVNEVLPTTLYITIEEAEGDGLGWQEHTSANQAPVTKTVK